jgi:hypothetical protein
MRLLYVDDRVPCAMLGYGYPRALGIIEAIAGRGVDLSLLATRPDSPLLFAEGPLKHIAVHAIRSPQAHCTNNDVESLISSADTIWISRKGNYSFLYDRFTEAMAATGARIIYDFECLSYRRVGMAWLLGQSSIADVRATYRQERQIARHAHGLVAVTEREAAFIEKEWGTAPVAVIGHAHDSSAEPVPYELRSGLLFVGSFYAVDCPNYDALQHFMESIWPDIRANCPGIEFTIVGYRADKLRDTPLGRALDVPGIRIVTDCEQLDTHYRKAAVVVIPTRLSAGLAFKATECLAYGTPFIAYPNIGRPIAERLRPACPSGPGEFSQAVVRIVTERPAWYGLQALQKGEADRFSPQAVRQQVEAALKQNRII